MSNRCAARTLNGRGARCDSEALEGLTVCQQHGGGSPQSLRKSEVAVVSRVLDGFVTPIPLDDPEANPAEAIYRDFRRTVARIRWLEGKIGAMTEQDLVWGLSKEEHIGATEFAGTNKTYEARVPVFEQLLTTERKHLLDLTKVLADTQFKAAELAVQQQVADYLKERTLDIVRALGRDPKDARVHRALAKLFRRRVLANEAEAEDQ